MTQPTSVDFAVELKWLAGRECELSAAGLPQINISAPKEFNGRDDQWTPEHLFVASVNSCFALTFIAVAEASKFAFLSFTATAQGKLEKLERGYQITEIVLTPRLVIKSKDDREKAERLLEKAEKGCFISNSIKSKVTLAAEIRF